VRSIKGGGVAAVATVGAVVFAALAADPSSAIGMDGAPFGAATVAVLAEPLWQGED
jgi:hypothetical protein